MATHFIRPRQLATAVLCAALAGAAIPGAVDTAGAQAQDGVFGSSLCAPVGFTGNAIDGLVAGFLAVPQSPSPEQQVTLCCSELAAQGGEVQIEAGARLANEVRLLFEANETAARAVTAAAGSCKQDAFATAFSTALSNDRIGSLLGSLLGTGGEVRSNPVFDAGGGSGGGFFVPSPN